MSVVGPSSISITSSTNEEPANSTSPVTCTSDSNVVTYASKVSLTQKSNMSRMVSNLQNTYFFSRDEARQISALAQVFAEKIPQIKINVKPSFIEKIRALCAKVLKFFGNGDKAVQLHNDGMYLFNQLKNTLLDKGNDAWCGMVIKENEQNLDVLMGFARITGQYRCLLNAELLATSPELKKFLEEDVLAMTKEEVQAGLENNLSKPSVSREEKFDQNNQIFKDLGRGFSIKFHIDSTTTISIDLEKVDIPSKQVLAYKTLLEAMQNLTEEQKEKVREFCKNFPSQGVLGLRNPRMDDATTISGEKTMLEVDISKQNPHVIVVAGGEGVKSYSGFNNSGIKAQITTPVCKYEFDYHTEDSHCSNINVMEFSGQTVKIIP